MTPVCLYEPAALESAAADCVERGHTWRYEGPDPRVADGCDRVAVSDPGQIADLSRRDDVLVTQPVLDWRPTASVCEQVGTFRVTIDHFVHLEALTAIVWATPPEVLIEVAVGPGRFGGRPGKDAVDLAKAVRQFDDVTLLGLSAEVRSLGMVDQLLQNREQLIDAGIVCDFISVSAPAEVARTLPAGLEIRHDGGAHVAARAQVISRPSLETAVINIGGAAGLRSKQDVEIDVPSFGSSARARVRLVEPDRALLTLPDALRDLVIGDAVQLPELRTIRFERAPEPLSPKR